jgi:hypothetical protein
MQTSSGASAAYAAAAAASAASAAADAATLSEYTGSEVVATLGVTGNATVGGTLAVTGALSATGNVTLASGSILRWEDSPGVVGITLARDVDGVIVSNREIRMNGSGTGALFGVRNTDGTANAFATDVVDDVLNRFTIDVNGKMWWGSGASGADASLYRSAAGTLLTSAAFTLADVLTINGAAPRLLTPATGAQLTVENDGGTQLKLCRTTGTAYLGVGINGDGASEVSGYRTDAPYVTKLLINPNGGNVLVGTTTDDGSNKMQINGGLVATSLRVNTAAVAETPSATHTLTINVNGTNYKVLLAPA